MVTTPLMCSSSRSKHTGHVGNSVCPAAGNRIIMATCATCIYPVHLQSPAPVRSWDRIAAKPFFVYKLRVVLFTARNSMYTLSMYAAVLLLGFVSDQARAKNAYY